MNCSVEIDGDTAQEFHVWSVEGSAMQDDDPCVCGALPWRLRGNRTRKGKVTHYKTTGRSFFGWIEFEVSDPVATTNSGEMLSAVEAAERAGVSRWLVYRALGNGVFGGAVSIDGKWTIPAGDVDRWMRHRVDREQVLVAYVAAHPGAKLNAIGELLGVRKTAAKYAVDKLIDAGLLRRDLRGQLIVADASNSS